MVREIEYWAQGTQLLRGCAGIRTQSLVPDHPAMCPDAASDVVRGWHGDSEVTPSVNASGEQEPVGWTGDGGGGTDFIPEGGRTAQS